MDIKLKYRNVFYSLYQSSKGLLAYTFIVGIIFNPLKLLSLLISMKKRVLLRLIMSSVSV